MEKRQKPTNHKQRTNGEIDDGNDRKNETADDKDSEEDPGDIIMDNDFALNQAGTDEQQWEMLCKKDYQDL